MAFFSLLPNARTKLAALTVAPAPGHTRRALALAVEIRADGAAVGSRLDVGAELLSAADVVGIDPRMIARVDPPRGAASFEPNYIPFVEFVDADFPWRYSFDGGAGTRVRPWVVLLALRPAEFEFLDQGSGPSPRIKIKDPGTSLPKLSQSWAFAHVHVAQGDDRVATLPNLVATRPEVHYSRLLCPRRLDPNSAYTLVLVPSTEAGRMAGLGLTDPVTPFDKPAWDDGTSAGLELPVYFQARFTTSALEDFELLARRLQPYLIDSSSEAAKPTEAFAGQPGFYPGYSHPTATFQIQDALMRTDLSVQAFNTDPPLARLLEKTLGEVIVGEDGLPGDGPDREDPLVAMPPYGWRFTKQRKVDAAQAAAGSFVDRINLDLKFRHSAGLGADIVRRNQEQFSRICWNQYRDVIAANLAVARLRTARELTAAVVRRRASRLPPSTLAVLTEPVHDLAAIPGGNTIGGVFSKAGVPASFVSRAIRRVAAKRPVRPQGAARVKGVRLPVPSIPGVGASAAPAVRPIPTLAREPAKGITDLFGTDVMLTATRPLLRGIAITPISLEPIASSVGGFFEGLASRKAKALLGGLSGRETDKLDPIMRAPVVAEPLVEPLRDFEGEAILRGLDSVPSNTVSVLKENRAFVEALLCGANHEMNNELRWREFPTDMRGTIFRRFWNRKLAPVDPLGDDVPEIHRWTSPLGSNYPAHDRDKKVALVLLVKGDIIRKYGMILAVLNHATSTTYVRGSGVDSAPIFSGQLGADACYFGFNVARETVLADLQKFFFVLFEAPGRVRFGLDAGSAAVRRDRFAYRTANLTFPLRSLGRDPKKPLLPAHLKTGNPAPANAATWDEFSWAHVTLDDAGYINMTAAVPGIAEAPNYWPASSERDSAKIARSFWQRPIAAVLPAKKVLS